MGEVPLLDEIVVVDSNSSDRTREIAAGLGVPVYIHQELLPAYGARSGKGRGAVEEPVGDPRRHCLWMDTDIVNIHPRFVYGLLGPLLSDPTSSSSRVSTAARCGSATRCSRRAAGGSPS